MFFFGRYRLVVRPNNWIVLLDNAFLPPPHKMPPADFVEIPATSKRQVPLDPKHP